MTNWAFETWPRILAGAFLLASGFALVHVLGQVVTGLEAQADAATWVISGLVLGGYLIAGGVHHWNPPDAGE